MKLKLPSFKLPFVSRRAYDQAVRDVEDFRAGADLKQKILMVYKTRYHELWNQHNRPRATNGRYIEKAKFKNERSTPTLLRIVRADDEAGPRGAETS